MTTLTTDVMLGDSGPIENLTGMWYLRIVIRKTTIPAPAELAQAVRDHRPAVTEPNDAQFVGGPALVPDKPTRPIKNKLFSRQVRKGAKESDW